MYIAALLFIFILGAIIGSFINVVSLRYNTGTSPFVGRSQCPTCNVTLKWYELVPIFSFFYLRGKCSNCNAPISRQYPLIEFASGLIFVFAAMRQFYYFPMWSGFPHALLISVLFFVYYAFIFSLLLVIVVYDARHTIIPNAMVYTFIVLSVGKLLVFFYLKNFILVPLDYFDLFAPILLCVPFVVLWYISKGRWIGFGDAKLIFGIGALLGFVPALSVAILAFWVGAACGIFLIVRNKFWKKNEIQNQNVTLQSAVPFAPFLIFSTLIIFFTHIDVLGIGNLLKLLY